MKVLNQSERPRDLDAGSFSTWLSETVAARRQGTGADVACGDCIGCCSSSYFIHVGPDEAAALARIPEGLLFAAPGLPPGHQLMGYDDAGRCPMLVDGRCSIYEDRPLTCRQYDCRVFPAAGLGAGGDEKRLINQQIERWEFSYPSPADRAGHDAVLAAAAFVVASANAFPPGTVPSNEAQLAMFSVRIHSVFLDATDASDVKTTVDRVLSELGPR